MKSFLKTKPSVSRLHVVTYRTRRTNKTYLDMNEPMFESHEKHVIDTMILNGTTVLKQSLHQYPVNSDLELALRKRVGEVLSCGTDNVMITRGSDAALKIIFEAFAFEEISIGVLDPTYESVYDMMTRSGARNVKRLPCTSSHEFSEALVEGPIFDLVYVCNPNNPLGYVIHRDHILREVDSYPMTLFVVDEAYSEHASIPVSVAQDVSSRPNLIVTRSFSKSYGIPGQRLGVIASSTDVLGVLRKLVCPTEVLETSKAIGLVCLHPESQKCFSDYFARVRSLRSLFVDNMPTKGTAGYIGVLGGSADSVGLFVSIEVADEGVAKMLVEYLDQVSDIMVIPKKFVDSYERTRHLVRCMIGTTESTTRLIKGIKQFFG